MERGTDDNRHIWRVVSVYTEGQRVVEGPWMTKRAAELLAEDIRLYREANPVAKGEEPQLVVERAQSW